MSNIKFVINLINNNRIARKRFLYLVWSSSVRSWSHYDFKKEIYK